MEEAYEWFWKATWNKAWTDAGYFEAAKISVAQQRLDDAIEELNRCLVFNAHNQKALALKASVLRLMKKKDQALVVCEEALAIDPFNYGCLFEQFLLTEATEKLDEMVQLMHGMSNNYDEIALDYLSAGLREEAEALWQTAINEGAVTPMTYYYIGRYEEAEQQSPNYCFPNRPEAAIALEKAKRENPKGARAPYYLGCLYYDKRQYDVAIENWELSATLDPMFPTVWRNLALARFNKQDRQKEAVEYMEKAFALDHTDSRILMELDQLYKRIQKSPAKRLQILQQYPQLTAQRDDLLLEEITLLNQVGKYQEAMTKLDSHQFHPWEGGEGKVPAQYQICRVELAKQAIADKAYDKAIKLLEECLEYPHHLGEGKLYGAQENDFYYLLGCCHEALGERDKAHQCWELAAQGPQEPAAAMYYNDAKPDKIFYQGLALIKLEHKDQANGRFYKLINFGKQHIFEKQVMDYFAVSLPDLLIWEDSLDRKNEIHCKYMLALGYYGLGETEKGKRYLSELLQADINHQGIMQLQSLIDLNHLSK